MKGTITVLAFALVTSACVDVPGPVPPPPVPTPEQCPNGFAPLDGLAGCYMTMPSAAWSAAEDACEQFAAHEVAAHLIIIDRIEEHDAMSLRSMTGDIWTGRMQQDDDDEYRNINYVDFDADYFGLGEPNDYGCNGLFCDGHPGGGDERCIEYKHDDGMWNDETCSRADRVICEWDDVAPYEWRPRG